MVQLFFPLCNFPTGAHADISTMIQTTNVQTTIIVLINSFIAARTLVQSLFARDEETYVLKKKKLVVLVFFEALYVFKVLCVFYM